MGGGRAVRQRLVAASPECLSHTPLLQRWMVFFLQRVDEAECPRSKGSFTQASPGEGPWLSSHLTRVRLGCELWNLL